MTRGISMPGIRCVSKAGRLRLSDQELRPAREAEIMNRPKLKTLPLRLQATSTSRIPTLTTKAGSTERERGRAWMEKRRRVALAQGYRCQCCDRVWSPHRDQVDHRTPLEQGGSNEDSNLDLLCDECHKAKTAAEAGKRARGF